MNTLIEVRPADNQTIRRNLTQTRSFRFPSFGLLLLLLCVFTFLIGAAPLLAAETTTAGSIQVRPGERSLIAVAPYTGDDNGNNTLQVEWDENGGDWTTLLGSAVLPHAATPYTYRITGLTNGAAYQVRVTYLDAEGVSGAGTQILAGQVPYNPLIHSSLATGSGKWAGNGGWGIPGGKYGEFGCTTCHSRNASPNIKRVKTSFTSPNAPTDTFPGSAVSFRDARDGSADFGDDAGGHAASTRVCEICHTQTSYHRFNSAGQASLTHYNQKDCTSCHRHDRGFKASCTGCHGDPAGGGFWPDGSPADVYQDRVGAHATHVQKIGNFLASGDKNNGAGTTVAHKNATCVFCHPSPGGTNADGGPHSTDTNGSPANTADLYKDGSNLGDFQYLNGTPDPDGLYNPAIRRCSNIDCHSNGQFTWSWYGDVIAPAAVDDLAAASGTEVGTVKLTWKAPGNDGVTGGKAYRYEVRYAESAIGTEAAWAAATIAGGPPTVKWPDFDQEMTVAGLTPGTTYHFAVRTYDETGNQSPLSSPNPNTAAKADTKAPVFRGLEKAIPAFAGGAVNLEWAAAADDSEPITYLIWWAPTSTTINYGAAPNATTSGLSHQVTGLPNGTNYHFAVRARDKYNNSDANTIEKEAIPQMPAEKEWFGRVYYAGVLSGGSCDSKQTYGGTTLSGGLTLTNYSPLCASDDKNELQGVSATGTIARWSFATGYAKATNIQGGSFTMYVKEKGGIDQTLELHLGHWNGSAFTSLGSVSKLIKRDSRGMVRFSLASISGQVPAGRRLAIELRKTAVAARELQFRYGSDRYNSILTVYEQDANARPNAFTVNTPAPGVPAGTVSLSWNAAADPENNPVTYDVYGSVDGGTSYPFVIASGISSTSTTWDTRAEGIGLISAVTGTRIKVAAGDGMSHNEGGTWYDHREATSATFTINNSSDVTAPTAITDLRAEHRPKAGSVYLYWTAPGDDGMEGRAAQYDIRWSTASITAANFGSATPVAGEPVPGLPWHTQGYEVLGLTPDQTYYFAMKTGDEVPNWSSLSNVVSEKGGPRCGVCHSTPPDEAYRAGNHEKHGYTQIDCAKCHGQEAVNFTNDHSDGKNKLAFNNPKKGFTNTAYQATEETATRVTFRQGGVPGGVILYDDTTGGGGYNDKEPGGDNNDNGSCFNFNASGVTGCHGTGTPQWGNRSSVSCAMCHGDPARTNSDPYGRPFEDTRTDTKYAGNVPIYKAAPPIDLLGSSSGKSVGQHLRHLNFSYRFTGDSCALCHQDNDHADGTVDVKLDKTVAGENAVWTPGNPGTCGGTSEIRCHGQNTAAPQWTTRSPEPNGPKLVQCNECHGFAGKAFTPGNPGTSAISHVKDLGQVRNCTWCHVEGHPQGAAPAGEAIVFVPNYSIAGINYSAGGIHLRRVINGRATMNDGSPIDTEAEVCWGCHEDQSPVISEWGTNTKAATGNSPYNYGSLNKTAWVGATWTSANFAYKTSTIQSTHSVNPAVTGPGVDTVDQIRCSYCHDVHDMNKSIGDTVSGAPYLRGSWKGNPYQEDGAPGRTAGYPGTSYYPMTVDFGGVPRGNPSTSKMGGYWIDQNSKFPTASWTMETSAGLCVLCHGSDINNMNKFGDPADAWVGANGHSNATLGGSGMNKSNIYDPALRGEGTTVRKPGMGYQDTTPASGDRMYGLRNNQGGSSTTSQGAGQGIWPYAWSTEQGENRYGYFEFNWGVDRSTGSTAGETGYHRFSCSKCHNPHASRLPRLMITNCLDVRHNTWDGGLTGNASWASGKDTATVAWDSQLVMRYTGTDSWNSQPYNRQLAYATSAQNCHRYVNINGDSTPEEAGWNKLTPWRE